MARVKRDEPRPAVIAQAIVARWSKASRGAPGATARNRVPEALALPTNPPSALKREPHPASSSVWTSAIILHLVAYGEGNQFQEPVVQDWTALASRLPEPSVLRLPHWRTPPITLEAADDGLQAAFSWHEVPGEPPRHHLHLRERVRLAAGQWARVRFNARHTDSDGRWYYEKYVINLGFVRGFDPALFVRDTPDFSLSDMAALR